MDSERGLAWLGRKIVWGLKPGQWDEWVELGADGVIDRLVEPDSYNTPTRPDPFADIEFDSERVGESVRAAVESWLVNAVTTPRPLETFMEFFWSDYFAVSTRLVRPQALMFGYMNLLATEALGDFSDLLRKVTVNPAMLDFLDGRFSTRRKPNENYARELLELYSVGIGNFNERDVRAASRALTGWTLRRSDGRAELVGRRHDDRQQTLLGVDGVHDVDTAIDAVLSHPATPFRVVRKIADAILGPGHDPALRTDITDQFALDWQVRPVVRQLLEHGVAGHAVESVVEPLPWFVTVRRFTEAGARSRGLRGYFELSGQVPLFPPNVGGFPAPEHYLSTSATIARFNFAARTAEAAARSGGAAALAELVDDLDGLARQLGLVDGFGPATRSALETLDQPVDRLAAALASPDLVVV